MKSIKSVVFISLLINASITSLAQQSYTDTEHVLAGKIIDDESQEALPGVHILNKNERKGTVSDIDGNFYIKLSETDTLIFSYVGYSQHFFTLQDSIKEKIQNKVMVQLSKSMVELESVKVFAYKNERDFKNAIIELELDEENPVEIEVPGYHYGPKKPVNPGVGSPISFLSSKLGKRAKQERKFNEAKKENAYRSHINSKYNREIVSRITGLKDKELDNFMKYCTLSDNFIDGANEYEIIVAINKCYKDFSNRN